MSGVLEAAGGAKIYAGHSMKEAHHHMNISQAEWGAMAVDFKKTLDRLEIAETEQEELIAIVENTKPDIVMYNYLRQ